MILQTEVPVDEDTFTIFKYLSGMGLWLILALILIVVVLYKKFRK